MNRRVTLAGIAAMAIFFCAPAAHSASVSFVIAGNATVSPGACPVQGYGSICRSGTCKCLAVQTGKLTGSFTGTAEVSATIDNGIDAGEPTLPCRPMFATASATATSKKGTKTAVLNVTAAYCQGSGSFNGAWGLESASNGSTGSGTVSGTYNSKTGKASLTFRGAAL
jgi:hypothetical protein